MKKGFTLIELLAVIVILAIIALITVPTLTKVVENARVNASVQSANGYIDSINTQIISSELNTSSKNINDGTYNISELDVNIKGKKPDNGIVVIEKKNVKEARFCIGKYSVDYDGVEAKLSSNNYCGDTSVTILSNGTKINPTKSGDSYTVDLTGKTNINCNNGAIPEINGNTLTVKNALGNTTCDIGSSLKYTFTHLNDGDNNIVMVKNEEVTSTILNDKKVSLDLKNYTLTGNGTGYLFENNDILNITANQGKINGTMDSINSKSESQLLIDGGEYNYIKLDNSTADLKNFTGHCTNDEKNCYPIMAYNNSNAIITNYYSNTSGKSIGATTNFTGNLVINNSNLNCLNDNCVWIAGVEGSKVELNNVIINSYGYGIRNENKTELVVNNSTITSGINNYTNDESYLNFCVIKNSKDGGKIIINNSTLKSDTGRGVYVQAKTNVEISKTTINTKLLSIAIASLSTGSVVNIKDSIISSADEHPIYLNPSGGATLNLENNKITSTRSGVANATGATINIVSGEFNVLTPGYEGAISNRANGTINICSANINGLSTLYDLYNTTADGTINYTSNVKLKNNKIYDPNNKVTLNNNLKCNV